MMPENLPFNSCDYQCDRCDRTVNCLVFKREMITRIDHLSRGLDPLSPEACVGNISNALFESKVMLEKEAEKKRSEARPAMRNAIILITRALQSDPAKDLEPLIENSLLAERATLHRMRARHHR